MTVSRLIPVLTVGCALLAAQGMATEAVAQATEAQPAGAVVAHTTEAVVTVEAVDQRAARSCYAARTEARSLL